MKNLLQILFVFLIVPVFSQIPDLDRTGDFVKHYNVSADPNIEIPLGSSFSVDGTLNWFYCVGNSTCTPSAVPSSNIGSPLTIPSTGLSITFSPSSAVLTATIAGTPSAESLPLHLAIRATNSSGYNETRRFVLYIRHPLDIVFTLDGSGSMGCPPTTTCLGGGTDTRWNQLRNGLNNLLSLTGLIDGAGNCSLDNSFSAIAEDRYSVVFFDSSDRPANNSALDNLIPVCSFLNNTNGIMREFDTGGQSPGGATSIGAGIVEAIDDRFNDNTRFNANSRKVLIPVTDGEQNIGRWLRISGSNVLIENSSTDKNQPNCTSPAGTNTCSSFLGGYEVLPVTVKDLDGNTSLFEALASGSFYDVSDPSNLMNSMEDLHAAIYESFSPNLVRREERQLLAQDSITFNLNNGITKLHFTGKFKNGLSDNYDFILKKNDEIVTDSFISRRGELFANFSCEFQRKRDFGSEGNWTFIYRAFDSGPGNNTDPTASITLSAIADDHNISFETSIGEDKLSIGDLLSPSVQLYYRGQPVSNANTTATIYKPNHNRNDLLARHFGTATNAPDATTCATKKLLNKLETDQAYRDTFNNKVVQILNLAYQGNGKYSGNYNGLGVTGAYKILFETKAEVPGLGFVERSEWKTVYVRFGEIDLGLEDKEDQRTVSQNGNSVNIAFRPAYSFNNQKLFVGPGFQHAINVQSNGIQTWSVTDNCNGRYTISMTLVDPSANPGIELSILDQEIYNGKVKDFDKPYFKYKANISFHTGLNLPQADLTPTYNPGFFAEIDLGYRISPRISIEVVGGYYGFSDSFYILGGTLYAKGQQAFGNNNSWEASLAAGLGIFSPKNETAGAGYSIRASLQKKLTPRWSLGLDAAYFNIPDKDYSFIPLGLVLNYYF